MLRSLILTVSFWALLTISATPHEAPETTAAKQSYISNHLVLFEVEAKHIKTYEHDRVPAIRYAIKNNGSETLTKIRVTVFFLDKQGIPFDEEEYLPVLVSDYNIGDSRPLRPNYTFRMDRNRWMTVDRLGDEWGGEIEIKITDIEFAE